MGKSDRLRAFDFIFLLKLYFIDFIDFVILLFYNIFVFLQIRLHDVLNWQQFLTHLFVFLKLQHEINQVIVAVQKIIEFGILRNLLIFSFLK